jgi:5-methyltetrahydrofolate--homocysteine methyltransferase
MSLPPFRERLRRGMALVGDGAWGTMLMARGLAPGTPPESFVLERPDTIREIARLYLEAGADLLTTDTFGATSLNLSAYGLADRADEINRQAVTLAHEIAEGRAYVSASVGPSGRLLAPLGETPPEEVRAAFERQIRRLVEAGADLICVETMTDLQEARLAVEAARAVSGEIPVIATMTFDRTPRGFFTIMGVPVAQAARTLEAAGTDVLGSNCGQGSDPMVEVARAFREVTSLPLIIQANAGIPGTRQDALVYPETPEFMAARVGPLLEAGVSIIGGCCGTTPDHVRAIRAAVTAHHHPGV